MKLDRFLQKLISRLFAGMFFLVPLFFTPLTSELFEFNKIILVYLATILITGTWLARMILARKIFFKRSFLDIPFILFLTSQLLSTLLSIDRHTSLFGYYSRFNGGLLSTISYLLLYWAFVSNCETDDVRRSIKASLISAAVVSIYGIFEHFGYSFSCLMFTKKFNVGCWVQDVQNRVFATLGQPNWLAAYLVALMPISWALMLSEKLRAKSEKLKLKTKNFFVLIVLSTLMFSCLLFTDSRSGFLGFIVSAVVFWFLVFKQKGESSKKLLKPFLILNTCYLILIFVFGSPFPQLNKYFSLSALTSHFSSSTHFPPPTPTSQPQSDTQIVIGGTESSQIRKIVWKGAINIFKRYPFFGSGVETFAYSYYQSRPIEHNLVSEWDFLYNKAHNEYLNYLATTGLFGLGTYLLFIGSFIFLNIKKLKAESGERKTIAENLKMDKSKFLALNFGSSLLVLRFSLISGWLSLLVTNFFGFSVVVTSLYFFLIPAFIAVLSAPSNPTKPPSSASRFPPQFKLKLVILLLLLLLLLKNIFNLWLADYYYSKGEKLNKQSEYQQSLTYLTKAISFFPSEPVILNEDASILASLAYLTNSVDASTTAELSQKAIALSDTAIKISPKNLNLWKTRVKVFYTLSTVDGKYLDKAIQSIQSAMKLAPTDPKLVYNLGLLYGRAGEVDKALDTINKAIELKPNYADARNALSIYYEDLKQPQKAVEQLEYILKYIAPDSKEVKDRLERLRK